VSLYLGAWIYWNPQGLSRPVMGLLYFYIILSIRYNITSDNEFNIITPYNYSSVKAVILYLNLANKKLLGYTKCTLLQAVRPIGGIELYLYSFTTNGTRRG
jgi:hypothetical protein